MYTNHAEIWLLPSKSFLAKEKAMLFYNPIKLYNPDSWKQFFSLKACGKHLFELLQAICGSIMPAHTLKGLIVSELGGC